MSLKFALLGFLQKGPKTGYELQKKIERSIHHFWPSTQSQVYRTLNEISESGLITSEIHYQHEKPNRKVYSITPKGEAELAEWLSSAVDLPPHRNQFLVQLFFSRNLTAQGMKKNLLHYQALMRERLAFLEHRDTQGMVDAAEDARERLLFEIIRQNGVRVLQSEIDWADDALHKLETI